MNDDRGIPAHRERAVLEAAVQAAKADASAVSSALTAYAYASDALALRDAAGQLYRALVLQAAGHESMAANGSTFAARCAHAQAALDAWGGGQ